MNAEHQNAARALLQWYVDMGVSEPIAPAPTSFYDWDTPRKRGPQPVADRDARPNPTTAETASARVFRPDPDAHPLPADEAVAMARKAALACADFEALANAVAAFDGCALKAGASKTVFADGAPGADLLVIGEGPGRDEDRIGKPFVGRAGQLLDRMLKAIGRDRAENVLISNVVYWRPPGNRTPTPSETAICRPFVERLIEITEPKAILLAGGAPLQALLGVTGIMRARGVWRTLTTQSGAQYPALAMFHPAFLLRQPANKRLAWADLKTLDAKLREG